MATKKSAGNAEELDAIAAFMKRRGINNSREVTSASWKWNAGEPKYFKVLGLPAKRERRPGEQKEPPYVCPVLDFDSSEHKQLICNQMLFNQFATYPGDTLIGKCFISIMSDVPGKNYKNFQTVEVPDPAPDTE